MQSSIKFRGHHLICLHFFKGEGYSREFIENLQKILKRAGHGEEIEVCSGPDEVCRICPYLKEEKCLYDKDAETEIRKMDRMALQLLSLNTDDRVTWTHIKEKVPEIFIQWAREFCKDCDWRWVCEKDIQFREFLDEKTKSKF